MTSSQQAKGDRAEREIAALIAELTGWKVRRKLGVGRTDDTGDLDFAGHPITAQVKDYADVLRSIREALHDLPVQRANAGNTFEVGFIRRRGGAWIAVMSVEAWATWAREAVTP